MWGWRNCVKYLKRGWKKGWGGGGKLGQVVGALKMRGWNPHTNYAYQFRVSSDFLIPNLGSFRVISMRFFRVVILFFKVMLINVYHW